MGLALNLECFRLGRISGNFSYQGSLPEIASTNDRSVILWWFTVVLDGSCQLAITEAEVYASRYSGINVECRIADVSRERKVSLTYDSFVILEITRIEASTNRAILCCVDGEGGKESAERKR